jgi:hypothetical protein
LQEKRELFSEKKYCSETKLLTLNLQKEASVALVYIKEYYEICIKDRR